MLTDHFLRRSPYGGIFIAYLEARQSEMAPNRSLVQGTADDHSPP